MRAHLRILTIGFCVAMGVAVALVFAAVLRDGGSSAPEERDSGLLLTGNRERLQVCIETLAEKSDQDSQKQAAEDALSRLAEHANWRAAELDKGVPLVVIGCQTQPFLLSSGVSYANGGFTEFPNFPEVKEPSQSRVMIFVLPDDKIDSMFGNSPVRYAMQEAICDGGQCSTVTTGLYVKSSELTGDDLERLLALAIGLKGLDVPADEGTETEAAGG